MRRVVGRRAAPPPLRPWHTLHNNKKPSSSLGAARAKPDVIVLNPGPVIRDVEITSKLAVTPASRLVNYWICSMGQVSFSAYLLHFAGAKQAKTREARIDKCTPLILKGRGLHD